MTNRSYHTLIIGATSFGVGLATALTKQGQRVLILESSHLAASDVSAPLKGEKCESAAKNALATFLLTHDILRRDGLLLPQAMPYALANLIKDSGAECLYNCIPTKVTACNNGELRVSVMSRRGKLVLYTKNLVDTTALGALPTPDGKGFAEDGEYTTSLRTVCMGTCPDTPALTPIAIHDDSLFLLSLTVENGTHAGEARLQFDYALDGVYDGSFTVLTFAAELAHTYGKPVMRQVYRDTHFCPSQSFSDPVAAFGAGEAYLSQLNKITHAPAYPSLPRYHERVDADVAVIGTGTAGAVSAVCAAEEGADVVSVDMNFAMGGVSTVTGVFDYYYGSHPDFLGGVNQKVKQLAERDGRYADTREVPLSVPLDRRRELTPPPTLKSLAYDEMASALISPPLFGYHAVRVSTKKTGNEKTVTYVDVTNGRKTVRLCAKQFIDGADGIICRLAGAEFNRTRERDNVAAPTSLPAWTVKSGNLRQFWCHNGRFSGFENEWRFSQMLTEAQAAPPYMDAEGKPKRPLVYTAPYIGIREIPTIKSKTVYTLNNILDGALTDTPAFHILAPLDITIDKPYLENESFMLWEMFGMHSHGIGAGIPIGVSFPKGFSNISIAGKSIGVGHELISAARMKGAMEQQGEAIGRLAAMASKQDRSPADIPHETLRNRLSYPLTAPHPYVDLRIDDGDTWLPVELPKTVGELKEILSTDYPATALFSIYKIFNCKSTVSKKAQNSILEALVSWIDDSEILGEQSALALGFAGDARALPRLQSILQAPPETRLHVDAVRHHHPWFSKTLLKPYTLALLAMGFIGKKAEDERGLIVDSLKSVKRNAKRIAAESVGYTAEELRVCAERALEKLQ